MNTIEEAIADLQKGKAIIVADDANRENEGDFIALADRIDRQMINFMITHGKGLVCTAINSQIAKHLNLPMMTENSTDPLGTAFTISVDHASTTTGISADERALTIRALADPQSLPEDFKRPGHVFPLIAKDEGVFERRGHTEAAVDFAKLSNAAPAAVICEIIKEDGSMARLPDLMKLASEWDLKLVTIEELVNYKKQQAISAY
ncbi:3,4-dihydroxy-2-butanone-4-phosphate synthase [Aciduricibacillus chroicocephali]|uniref:3,4-dihydroxy-2-butanone 4-phosphate synthase n=1 Tax=Aciduricibacillus chroicocephali TaxID=3054939 RepID=A0ABY9KW49_9BACI|nr:3,4-dihydroxy-2-butanone-4-phosphate synthase [Bacillaceae bacterium 44XB]